MVAVCLAGMGSVGRHWNGVAGGGAEIETSIREGAPACSFGVASRSTFLEQRFQFRQRIEILRASRGTFGADESRQVQTAASAAEDIHVQGVESEGIEISAPGYLSQQIDVSDCSRR